MKLYTNITILYKFQFTIKDDIKSLDVLIVSIMIIEQPVVTLYARNLNLPDVRSKKKKVRRDDGEANEVADDADDKKGIVKSS